MKRLLCMSISLILILGCISAGKINAYSGEKNAKIYICTMADVTKEYSYSYSDDYFYRNNQKYYPDSSILSLAVSMSAFSSPEYMNSNEKDKFSADSNIRKTYKSLGFKNAEFYNYNLPVTNTDDKVAFSIALKNISRETGKSDTLICVVVRGGNYGGEWVSNFHIFGNYDDESGNQEHYGFRIAARQMYEALNEYIKNNRSLFEGDVKIWLTGYSRGAAVANLLSHMVNTSLENDDYISQYVSPENVYSYQFACPAGARTSEVNHEEDRNIFVVNSPSDVVPMMAPEKWGFSVYGNIIYLPDVMSDTAQQYFDEILKDTQYEGVVPCSPEQTQTIDQIMNVITDSISEQGYYGLQSSIMKMVGSSFTEQSNNSSANALENNELVAALSDLIKIKFDFDLQKTLNGAMYAHFPEHYISLIHDEVISYSPSDGKDKKSYILGDVNGDENVTLEDVVEIQRYLAKLTYLSEEQSLSANVNRDNKITLDDVVTIQKYIAQLIVEF